LTRNTEPHQKWLSSAPPTTGPTATPRPLDELQIAIARVRFSSGVLCTMTDRVAGISSALPAPMTARATISQAGLVAKAPAPEAAPNSASPAMSVFRGPKRSASAPPAKSVPAKTRV